MKTKYCTLTSEALEAHPHFSGLLEIYRDWNSVVHIIHEIHGDAIIERSKIIEMNN